MWKRGRHDIVKDGTAHAVAPYRIALKQIALEERKHDYDVLQEAVDAFLKARGAGEL